jgi:hypothetical protein
MPCLKYFDSNVNLDDKVDSADLAYIAENWTDEISANLYFGENFNDVNSAITSSSVYVGNFSTNSYQPDNLEPNNIYYWRIDETDANNLHKGNVWQFTTGSGDSNIGYWKLDGKTEDSGDNNNDGTAFGNLSTETDTNWGRCFSFDGNDDYIQMPNEPTFDLTTQITIAAWVRLGTDEEGVYTIASKGNSFWLYRDNYAEATVFYCDGLDRPVQSSIDICDDQWHHVVAVYDGTERAIYIDGIKDASSSTTEAIALNDEYLLIGNNELSEESNNFKGMIRQLRIYSGRLSDDEILWLSKTDNYSPEPFDGQNNVSCDSILLFFPQLWMNNKPADLNKDFTIDFKDFSILAKDWLENVY